MKGNSGNGVGLNIVMHNLMQLVGIVLYERVETVRDEFLCKIN